MTQAEDSNLQFSPNCIPHELPPRVFNVKGMYRFGAPHAFNFCRVSSGLEILSSHARFHLYDD